MEKFKRKPCGSPGKEWGNKCKKTSPNNPPTAKLTRSFKVCFLELLVSSERQGTKKMIKIGKMLIRKVASVALAQGPKT